MTSARARIAGRFDVAVVIPTAPRPSLARAVRPVQADGSGEARLVSKALRERPWGASGRYSCFYALSAEAQGHGHHAREFAARGAGWVADRSQVARIEALTTAAVAALARGAAGPAAAAVREALGMHPAHAPALRLLAQVEALAGRPEAAAAALAQANEIEGAPSAAQAWVTGRPASLNW